MRRVARNFRSYADMKYLWFALPSHQMAGGLSGEHMPDACAERSRRVVSGSKDRTVRIWDAESGEELRILCGHEVFVVCVAFSPDGRRIVSGSYDQTVRIWDAESGGELQVLRGHEKFVHCVAFSPD